MQGLLPKGMVSGRAEHVLSNFRLDDTPCQCKGVKHYHSDTTQSKDSEAVIMMRQTNTRKYFEYILPKIKAATTKTKQETSSNVAMMGAKDIRGSPDLPWCVSRPPPGTRVRGFTRYRGRG